MVPVQKLCATIALTRDWPYFLLNRLVQAHRNNTTFRLRNGQTITIGADQAFVINEIYRDRVYDIPGIDLASCRTIVDVGANVGVFALYAAATAPNAIIHCFEPATATFAALQRNVAANHVQVVLHKAAISTSCGTARFYHSGAATEWSLNDCAAEGFEQVDCIDLDRLFELIEGPGVDFLKMDIEGAERDVLNGARDDQLQLIGALSVEWHHSMELLEGIVERLRRIGFTAQTHVAAGDVRYLRARQ